MTVITTQIANTSQNARMDGKKKHTITGWTTTMNYMGMEITVIGKTIIMITTIMTTTTLMIMIGIMIMKTTIGRVMITAVIVNSMGIASIGDVMKLQWHRPKARQS